LASPTTRQARSLPYAVLAGTGGGGSEGGKEGGGEEGSGGSGGALDSGVLIGPAPERRSRGVRGGQDALKLSWKSAL
jgi:hypothetical protein